MSPRFTIIDLLSGRQLAQVDYIDDVKSLVEILTIRGFVPRLQPPSAAGETPEAVSQRH